MNEIHVGYADGHRTRTHPLHQYDYGQFLVLNGFRLPTTFEVHFANNFAGEGIIVVGQNDRVAIPDILLTTGRDISAWLYCHDGEDSANTMFTVEIPVIRRAGARGGLNSIQQDLVSQMIATLNAKTEEITAIRDELKKEMAFLEEGSGIVILDAGDAEKVAEREGLEVDY